MIKILVVDNHNVTLKYLEYLLGDNGYEVRTAQDGIAALDIARDFKPDVFFVDLVMPYIRGEKLIQILRSADDFKNSKIVVLSAIAAEIESNHIEMGADACVAKAPFKSMGEHILYLLDGFKSGSLKYPVKEVFGANDVFKRAVTTELIASRRHTDIIMDNISDGIFELNMDNRIVYVNAAALSFSGMDESAVIGSPFSSLWGAENTDVIPGFLNTPEHDGRVVLVIGSSTFELTAKTVTTENDKSTIVIVKDITLFQERLNEKDRMIKEVYHRVKNNLVLISSIVNLQIGINNDSRVKEELHVLKNRIDSIAIILGSIFKSKDPHSVNLGDYVDELFASLYLEMDLDVSMGYTVNIPVVKVDIDSAVPLGLILTELFANSFRYGFLGKDKKDYSGEIILKGSVTQGQNPVLNLTFSDNGSGDEKYFSPNAADSLSLNLVTALTEQLGSSIEYENSGGAVYRFSVPVKKT